MTPRQREALDFITGYCREHGYSPNFREIADALGLKSKNSVAKIVGCLESSGHVVREHYRARGVIPADMNARAAEALRAADELALVTRALLDTMPAHKMLGPVEHALAAYHTTRKDITP